MTIAPLPRHDSEADTPPSMPGHTALSVLGSRLSYSKTPAYV